ncbi:hypothetical protein HDU98_010049 [Podochytrium sp. JEL0797]|nr:hypothetical protein HDU98_010049 [Podochytrium sp. JEL0797]
MLKRIIESFPPIGSAYPVLDPSNGQIIASVSNVSSRETVRQAVDVAASFKTPPAKERMQMLLNWHDLILQHSEDLATICSLESGKPLRESKGELAYAASFLQYYAHEALRTTGDTIPSPHPHNATRLWTLKQPLGPCALITPWNFPLAMVTRKIAPSLAAGNSNILKPAPETPLSSIALKLLANDAGIPDAAFQVLTADRENAKNVVGRELMADSRVRKISFTGSTGAGVSLMEQAAASVKRVSMELGGNAPFLVFEDADIDRAVDGCMIGKFRNAGQACISVNRVFVHEKVHDEFVHKLAGKMESLCVGNGLDPTTTIGPLITSTSVSRVHSLVSDSITAGAILTFQTPLPTHLLTSPGNYFPPTLLTAVTDTMPIFHSEIFGPVLPISKFQTEDEVIRRANSSAHGLAAFLYTRDVGRVHRVSEALEAGMVGINDVGISNEVGPFGGVKMSGVGREGGRQGIDEFLDTKYVCLGL